MKHAPGTARSPAARAACGLVAALALLFAAPALAKDPPPAPSPLRGADTKALLDKAAQMKTSDPRALGLALTALGDPVAPRGPDLDFLVEYALRETNRPLRLLAIESARRIDPAAAPEMYLARTQSEKDPVRVMLAVEALGYTGNTKAHPGPLVELLKHPSSMVAVAAADALARLGSTKDVPQIVDLGLSHPDSHVTDHAAWAVQDIQKKPQAAAAIFQKIAAKKGDPRAIRAEATVALLEDKTAEAQKWPSPFEANRKALLAAPGAVPVKGIAELVPRVEAAVNWIKERMPAEHWMMCAVVKEIHAPGPNNETRPDLDAMALDVSPADSALPPHKLAYLMFRQAGVLWRKQVGEPYKGHRGWETAIFDSYDLCVIGKLYDAGPGGLSREKFVAQILGGRPWGGL